MDSGIYILKFPDGNYVGQSNNVNRRLYQHRSKIDEGIHPNKKIRSGVLQYGMPTMEVLEYCDLSELNEREIYWMNVYDCYPNGYNQKPGGDYPRNLPIVHDTVAQPAKLPSLLPILGIALICALFISPVLVLILLMFLYVNHF